MTRMTSITELSGTFRKGAVAGIAAFALALAIGGGGALAQSSNNSNGGGDPGPSAGSAPTGGGGGRVWSFRGAAHGPILCASADCMGGGSGAAPFAAATSSPNYPGYGRVEVPVRPAENCSETRYVYPNGTVIVQKDCPRVILGRR